MARLCFAGLAIIQQSLPDAEITVVRWGQGLDTRASKTLRAAQHHFHGTSGARIDLWAIRRRDIYGMARKSIINRSRSLKRLPVGFRL